MLGPSQSIPTVVSAQTTEHGLTTFLGFLLIITVLQLHRLILCAVLLFISVSARASRPSTGTAVVCIRVLCSLVGTVICLLRYSCTQYSCRQLFGDNTGLPHYAYGSHTVNLT